MNFLGISPALIHTYYILILTESETIMNHGFIAKKLSSSALKPQTLLKGLSGVLTLSRGPVEY